ncbi:MAG: hypothetical protein ACRD29_26585 [Acidimicrobiales bacterium]
MADDELATDEERLVTYAVELAVGVADALPAWVVRSVERIATAWRGDLDPELREVAEAAGERARAAVGSEIRVLLETDVDEQWTSPLDLVRRAARYPTDVLRAAGVPPVRRDEVAERLFPDDTYDLAPASFADLSPSLAEAGIVWGAAKAHVVLARRRREGQR